jgi:hypothetical protein
MVHPQALVEPMGLPLRPNPQKRGDERNGIFEPWQIEQIYRLFQKKLTRSKTLQKWSFS